MKLRWMFVAFGVLVVVVAVRVLMDTLQPRTLMLPNGAHVTYLGATYGRLHTRTEWRLKWGLLPIERKVHRFETPTETLQLWFRIERRSGLPTFYTSVAVTEDGRTYQGMPRMLERSSHPPSGYTLVISVVYPGMPADGGHASVFLYDFSLSQVALRGLRVRLPKAPAATPIKQPMARAVFEETRP